MIQEIAAAAQQSSNELVPYMSSAAAIMYAQRALKAVEAYQRFVKAFPGADKWAHRVVAGLGSLVAALGIGYTLDYNVLTGGQMIVKIPALTVLLHGLKDFVVVYLFQQTLYDSTKQPPPILVSEVTVER